MVSSVCVRGENGEGERDTHGHGDGAGVDEVDGARVVAELLLDVVHLELDVARRVARRDGHCGRTVVSTPASVGAPSVGGHAPMSTP